MLKFSDATWDRVIEALKEQYPKKLTGIVQELQKFRPDLADVRPLLMYAVWHMFALGDINLDWDTYNPRGFCSIGERHEAIFNEIRTMGFELLKRRPDLLPAGEISFFENMKIIIETPEKLPPPYNGAHREVKGKDDQIGRAHV